LWKRIVSGEAAVTRTRCPPFDGGMRSGQRMPLLTEAMKPADLDKARATTDAWKPQQLDNKANGIDVPDAWTGKGTSTSSVDMKKAIRNIQAILNNNGFDAGTPDGEMGAKTVSAIKSFQKSIGQDPSGKINDDTVKALLERNAKNATKA
jgi:localization factor PodJL